MAVKYLSGKRLQGTAAERTALNLASPPATSWKELGRITAGSGGSSSLTTSAFADKDNLMILYNSIGADPQMRVGSGGSIDTGTNYCQRYSENGGSDGTFASSPHNVYWYVNGGAGATGSEQVFGVTEAVNISAQEKLFTLNSVDNASGTGAGTATGRYERAMKWVNTSAQINIARMEGISSATMAEGSEMVVLGYDNDEADSGTNFWQELASVELSSAGDTINVSSFAAKKYLMIQCKMIATGTASMELTFNNDTGSNYARMRSQNGGTANNSTSRANIDIGFGDTTDETAFFDMYVINTASKEKLLISELNATSSGAGNAPHRRETVGKWANTSNQITRVDITNPDSGSFNTGTYIKVWGAD